MQLYTILKASEPQPGGGRELSAPTVRDTKGREWQPCWSTVEKYNQFIVDALAANDILLEPYLREPIGLVSGPFPASTLAEALGTPGLLVDIVYDELMLIQCPGGEVTRRQTVDTLPGHGCVVKVVTFHDD